MNQKIGQQGAVIARDYESAIEHVQNLYRMTIRHLNDEEFAHFYYLSNYRKEQILAPLKELLSCRNLHFRKTKDNTPYGNHYDFYLGQIDEFNTPCGTGLYGWEWEKDEDGDTSINYFVGEFKDDDFTDNGVRYHYSSEDAKIYFDVKGSFCVYAAKGVGEYRNAHSHIYSAREVDRRNEARKEEKRRRAIEMQEAERRAREKAEHKAKLENQEKARLNDIKLNRTYYLEEAELVSYTASGPYNATYYGFKDAKTGKVIIPANKYKGFSSLTPWKSGERIAFLGNKSLPNYTGTGAVINKVGEELSSNLRFEDIGDVFLPLESGNIYVLNGTVVHPPYDMIYTSPWFHGEVLYRQDNRYGFFDPKTQKEIPTEQSVAVQNYRKRLHIAKWLPLPLLLLIVLFWGLTIVFFDSSYSIISLWPELSWWKIILYILGIPLSLFLTMLFLIGCQSDIEDRLSPYTPGNPEVYNTNFVGTAFLFTICYWLTKAVIAILPILGGFWSWTGIITCGILDVIAIIYLIIAIIKTGKGLFHLYTENDPFI